MANKIPADITSGDANRGSVVHASDASLSDLSRSHTEEDISRLQGAVNDYSASLTYKIGDITLESGIVYRCNTDINTPEAFNPTKWDKITQNSPWDEDEDANQFKLFNIPLIEMENDGTTTLNMRRTTSPGITGNSAVIDFRGARSTGGNIVYGSVRNLINDPAPGTTSSEIQFQARQADSLTVFMTINEGTGNHIRCFRPLNIHQTNLTFDNSLSLPGASTTAIYRDTDLVYNDAGASNSHVFKINGTDVLLASQSGINSPSTSFQENGVPISPIGDHDIWFDASAAIPVSSGAVSSRFSGTGVNQKAFSYIPYVPSADTFSVIKFTFPRNYDAGPLTAVIKWTTQIEGAGDVVWGIAGVAIPDGGDYTAVATDYGTEVTVTDTQTTINQEQISARTTNISLNGTIAKGNSIYLRIRRVGTSGADTFTEDAQLLGVYLEFTTSEATST